MKKQPDGMLIATKLLTPPLQTRMLIRRHLIGRLLEGRDSRLIVVSGEAGSGKTSLVCQWVKECKIRAAWYSLDTADNQTDVFLRYLLTALIDLHGTLAAALKPQLHSHNKLTGAEIVPLVVEQLVRLEEDVYLVLDDYHFITSKEVHSTLSFLLDRMPEKMHVVVMSRHSIPFPLSRFKVRGQATEILATDIHFTEEETARFFDEIMGLQLSDNDVRELARLTEGWVGGLQLLALSLKGKEIPKDLNGILGGARQDIADYLVSDVISVQSKKVRGFLTTTSLLDRFDADLCRETTGLPEAPDILEYAYRSNIFLIPLDKERTWYRYHHLFSDVVRKQIKKSAPETFKRVQQKAALWFADRGYLEDAFRHAFVSEDYDFAAALLEDHMLQLFERCEILSGLRWLSKVPHDVLIKKPLLRLHACGFRLESLRLPETEAVLEDIENRRENVFDQYDHSRKKLCEDLFIYFRYAAPHFSNPASADVNKLNELVSKFSSDHRQFLIRFIRFFIAEHYLYKGDPQRALDILKETSAMVFSSESLWGRMTWFRLAAIAELLQGHLHRVEALVREAHLFLNDSGSTDMPLKFLLYLPAAWVFYYRNDLEQALEYGTAGLRYVEQLGSVAHIVDGNALLFLIYHAIGNREKSAQRLEEMRRISKTAGSERVAALVDSWTAYLSMDRGDIAWAARWEDRRKSAPDEPFSIPFVRERLTFTNFLYQQRSYRRAVSELESLRDCCLKQNMMEAVLNIDLLLSASLYALSYRARAKTVMDEALVLSEADGVIRPFVNYMGAIAPILRDMADHLSGSVKSGHLTAIMTACGIGGADPGGGSRQKVNGKAILTRRELEILKMIAAGYRNKEIADKVFVSLPTIKTHTSHIFEKLGVNNRDRAVRRAEDLQLLRKSS
jgi:LuxR family transcriptional regulator, maltose regulon positive regulatory protein